MTVRIKDGEFVDSQNRVLNLRGINVSGSSKLPTSAAAQSPSSLDPSTPISFVGRPFPLAEADTHFTRLRACGFTLLRFIVTWEAIEHAGPREYDVEYLKYIRAIVEKAKGYGMYIYIDPHQDVWSRWTGGDGAPLWTLEAAGFDVRYFAECEAALTRETYGRGHSTAEKARSANDEKKEFPKMIWPTNYFKLACATMFTLFWAGERYAPNCKVDGVNIQEYLQGHYVNAMRELVKYLDGLDNVVGVGTMNEPSAGYVNVTNLEKGFGAMGANGDLRYGLSPTPFQGMVLGEGHVQNVGDWSNGFLQHVLSRPDRTVAVDPKGKRAWKEGRGCVWKEAGVWDVDPEGRPRLLKPDHFAAADFGTEFYVPFAAKYTSALREVWSGEAPLMVFVELPPLEFASTPFPKIDPKVLPDAVNATHWYDGITLFTKSWRSNVSVDTMTRRPLLGYSSIFKAHSSHLAAIKRLGEEKMGGAPTLIGECGIPYDMNGGRSYRACRGEKGLYDKLLGTMPLGSSSSDPFAQQSAAMDHTISCLESNLLSYTLWCYTPDNSNRDGDIWNGEDLSVYSKDQRGLGKRPRDDVYDGLRAAEAFVRPYAMCTAGKPLENRFSLKNKFYRLRFESTNGIESNVPTEIFVPKLWCRAKAGMEVKVSDGRTEVEAHDHWFVVRYWPSEQRRKEQHSVTIKFVK